MLTLINSNYKTKRVTYYLYRYNVYGRIYSFIFILTDFKTIMQKQIIITRFISLLCNFKISTHFNIIIKYIFLNSKSETIVRNL